MSLVFIFPGQGSQSVGMLSALAERDATVTETFAKASEALGYDLWQVVQDGPAEKLNATDVTQPAMLAAGVACWNIWQNNSGPMPVFMAGHSLGEYTALVCAGVISFTDAIQLVAARGQFMQQAVAEGQGAMAAILGLEDEQVIEACRQAAGDEVLQAVNFNSPGQVVVAGNKSAVERVIPLVTKMGAKRAIVLPVSVPSHCALMKPAAEQLAERLQSIPFTAPQIPVINNVDVKHPDDADSIQDALVRQLYMPVRWVEIIQFLQQNGVDRLIECGPGRVLAGLNRRIDRKMLAQAMYDSDSVAKALSH